MSESLDVQLYGTRIGELTPSKSGAGVTFRATAEGLSRFGANSTVLSFGLPLSSRPVDATAFVGGLLPEGETLANLQRKLGLSDVFGLIQAVGKEVAGAVSFLSPGSPVRGGRPDWPRYSPVDEGEIALLLDAAAAGLAGGSSLPGYQRKITLASLNGTWYAPIDGAPSTHILKPVAADRESAVQSENYALDLGRAMGLLSNDSYVAHFDSRPTLVIERYDRVVDEQADPDSGPGGSSVRRVHQEDAAQALRLRWNDSQAKFGTSMSSIAALLPKPRLPEVRVGSTSEALAQLLRYMTFNVAIGNTDAHAKNFSFLHSADGSVGLAPLYDVAPIALAYDGNKLLALPINGTRASTEVTVAGLRAEAAAWGIGSDNATSIIESTLLALEKAVLQTPAHETISAKVPNYILGQTFNLLDGKAAGMRASVPLDLSPSVPRPTRPSGIPEPASSGAMLEAGRGSDLP